MKRHRQGPTCPYLKPPKQAFRSCDPQSQHQIQREHRVTPWCLTTQAAQALAFTRAVDSPGRNRPRPLRSAARGSTRRRDPTESERCPSAASYAPALGHGQPVGTNLEEVCALLLGADRPTEKTDGNGCFSGVQTGVSWPVRFYGCTTELCCGINHLCEGQV